MLRSRWSDLLTAAQIVPAVQPKERCNSSDNNTPNNKRNRQNLAFSNLKFFSTKKRIVTCGVATLQRLNKDLRALLENYTNHNVRVELTSASFCNVDA